MNQCHFFQIRKLISSFVCWFNHIRNCYDKITESVFCRLQLQITLHALLIQRNADGFFVPFCFVETESARGESRKQLSKNNNNNSNSNNIIWCDFYIRTVKIHHLCQYQFHWLRCCCCSFFLVYFTFLHSDHFCCCIQRLGYAIRRNMCFLHCSLAFHFSLLPCNKNSPFLFYLLSYCLSDYYSIPIDSGFADNAVSCCCYLSLTPTSNTRTPSEIIMLC